MYRDWETKEQIALIKKLKDKLNTGLMYAGAGGGGGTTAAAPSAGAPTASVSGGKAELPSQVGMEIGANVAEKMALMVFTLQKLENLLLRVGRDQLLKKL